MTDEVRIQTEENELTLQEMSEALPDTPVIMTRIGESWWHLFYAARGGNWSLADYYLRRVRKLEDTLAVLRPKHRERLLTFRSTALPEVIVALDIQDFGRFEKAFHEATRIANQLHAESGYPYIKWTLPVDAPVGLELGPVEPGLREQPV
jgi:hypothetical protein